MGHPLATVAATAKEVSSWALLSVLPLVVRLRFRESYCLAAVGQPIRAPSAAAALPRRSFVLSPRRILAGARGALSSPAPSCPRAL